MLTERAKMKRDKNLKDLSTKIARELLEAISLIDILEDIIDGDRKSEALVSLIRKNIKTAFYDNEEKRHLISPVE